jgi:hypothetical protein
MMIHEFKPETLEEKKKKKEEEEAARVFKSTGYRETVSRIADLLYKQMYYGMIRFDAANPKTIGNVMFWTEVKDGKPMLMYNKHPKNWDKDAVILQLEVEEYQLINNNKTRTPY